MAPVNITSINDWYTFYINTDASFSPPHKVAGYAYWIESNHYMVRASGLIPVPVANSSVAECLAMEQALRFITDLVRNQPFLASQPGIKLHFTTDSTWAISALQGRINRGQHAHIAKRIKRLTEGYAITTEHVKSHAVPNGSVSQFTNDWCDRNAKIHLRKKVVELDAEVRETL